MATSDGSGADPDRTTRELDTREETTPGGTANAIERLTLAAIPTDACRDRGLAALLRRGLSVAIPARTLDPGSRQPFPHG